MKNKFSLKYFSNNKMKRQLITLYIFAVMVSILIIGSIISIVTYRKMTTDYENLTHSQEKLVHSVFVSTSIYLHSIYENISEDSELLSLLYGDESDLPPKTGRSVNSYFENILSGTAMLASLHLYIPEPLMENIAPNNYILPLTGELTDSLWYKKSSETTGCFWMSSTRKGQNDMEYWELHYYCRVPLPRKNTYAVLAMSVSNDYLRNLISNQNYQIYVSVNNDPVFISSDRSYEGSEFPAKSDTEGVYSYSGTFSLFGRTVIGSLKTAILYQSSDALRICVADTNALPEIRRLLLIFLLIMLFALLVSAIIIFLYASYFSSRIDTLRLAMEKVSNNDYEIVDSIQGDDELTATFRDMKVMVGKLKKAEAEIYQAQIHEQMIANQQQQMELKLLANQINPHFLYNTLESIRMKAFAEGNREVANAIKLLSKSMRYVLNNTRTTATTLDKELDYVSTYLAIQKLRFGSRINYDIRVDDHLNPSKCQILPILLQPIVENAISHGFADVVEGGHIILSIHSAENRKLLIAHIFDNGSGMTKQQLLHVNSHLDTPAVSASGHGIGLYNINNRIRLFYGPEYGIAIRSKINFGTCVTVTIPLNYSEEDSEP